MELNEKDSQFLAGLHYYASSKPDIVPLAIQALTSGFTDALKKEREYASDMETLASVAVGMAGEKRVSKKTREYFERLAISKLEKHDLKTFCRWDWAIREKTAKG